MCYNLTTNLHSIPRRTYDKKYYRKKAIPQGRGQKKGGAGKENNGRPETHGPVKGRACQKNSQSPGKSRFQQEKTGKNNEKGRFRQEKAGENHQSQSPGQKNTGKSGKKERSRSKIRELPDRPPSGDSAQYPKAALAPPPLIGVSQIMIR